MEIQCTSIGTVSHEGGYSLLIEHAYRKGLVGLEGFGHVQVFWFADKIGNAGSKYVLFEKPYTKGPAQIGVFATRSPYRPNSLCISVAQLICVDPERGRVELAWIDAEPGTPIFDTKPYHGSDDRVRDLVMPSWCDHWPRYLEESEAFNWEEEFAF